MHYGTAFAGLILILQMYLSLRRRSTVRNIRGPACPSWVFGHMLQLLLPPQYGDYEFIWQKLYGPVYRLKGCFGQDRLMISDPLALQYMVNSPHFAHGPILENGMNLMFDENCVMAVKGETHKRFRAALNIGFTAAAVRNYQPVFERVAQRVAEQLEEASGSPLDICPVLSDATLSAIGQATFNYSTEDFGEEFVASNARIMALSYGQSAVQILGEAIGARLPKWAWRAAVHLPTATFKVLRTAKYLAHQIGHHVVQKKLDAAQQGLETNSDIDIFDILLNPNRSDKKSGLSRDEIVAQTGIILIGGQDTAANTMTFGLLELARNPEFQDQLRAEIHATGTASAILGYDSMPLLNAFIKEALRLYPAGALSERIAIQDTVIPLMDSLKTSTGELTKHIRVGKGQIVIMAVASYQRLESFWGDDAHKFRPSRWIDGTISQGQAVGPYANLLAFFGGPGVCLGWRFAILEMQVFFCELVGRFSFALSEDDFIRTRFAGTLMPIMSDGQKAAPLCITPL
ncbi:cytochrome P450 [Mycena olivaceomarginata]|nr:cytochrome P450 [Mycena olivaceomarginata]